MFCKQAITVALAATISVVAASQSQDIADAGAAKRLIATALEVDDACRISAPTDVAVGTSLLIAEDDGCALKLLQLAVQRRFVGGEVDVSVEHETRTEIAGVGVDGSAAANMLAKETHNTSKLSTKLRKRAKVLRARLRDFVQDEVLTQEALLASLDEEVDMQEGPRQAPRADSDGHLESPADDLQHASGEEGLNEAELQRDLREEIEHEGQLETDIQQEIEHEQELEDELQNQHRHELELEHALRIEVQDPTDWRDELGQDNQEQDEGHEHQEELEHEHEKDVEQELENELEHEPDANKFREIERELGDVLGHDQLEHEHEEDDARKHDEYRNEERREHELEDELVHEQGEQHRREIRDELEDLLAREHDEEANGLHKLAHSAEESNRSQEGHHARDEALGRKLKDELGREHDERKREELQHELDDVFEREHDEHEHEHEHDEDEDDDYEDHDAHDGHDRYIDHDDDAEHDGYHEHHEHDEHGGHHADIDSQRLCLPQHLLNFSTSLVSHSNLGGAGPDDGEETLVYESVAFKDGMPVDLVITATTDYTPGDSDKNGMHGGVFGLINLRVDSHVDLLFRFASRAGDPIQMAPFFFTFFDIDQGMAHSSRKSVTAHGLSDFKLAKHTELAVEYIDDSTVRFQSSERGNREDNPNNPSALTKEAAERTVTLVFPTVSEFAISLEEANYSDASHGRNFLFSGASSMVCGKEHTCTDYECPPGYHIRTMAEFLLCADHRCTSLDRDTCCYREVVHAAM